MKTPFNNRSFIEMTCRAFLAIACCVFAGGYVRASVPVAQKPFQFTVADFDGDRHPDTATVQVGFGGALDTRYRLYFQLSTGSTASMDFTAAAGGLWITSRDVNGDSFPDVLVTTAWTQHPIAVLLNDGHGNFTRWEPQAFPVRAWELESEWILDSVDTLDSALALPSCSSQGDFKPDGGRLHVPPGLESPIADERPSLNDFLSCVSLGRAPPSAIHNV